MNGFLVAGRCLTDDIPLGLFATEDEAIAFARKQTRESVIKNARLNCGAEVSVIYGVDVMEFEDGESAGWDRIQHFI